MHRTVHRVTELALFVLMAALLTAIWVCLWLPPF